MEPKPSKRRRRGSKDLPPEFSELLNKLNKVSASFVSKFDSNRPRMSEIVKRFQSIAAETKAVQVRADRRRSEARDCAEAPFRNARASWGLSLLVVPVTTVVGVATAVSANIAQMLAENGGAQEVESLGKEFTRILEPLKKELEEIRSTCERLEQTSTEVQAQSSLSDMEDFRWILTRLTQLGKRSQEVLRVTVDVLGSIGKLVALIVQVFRFTSNSEHEEQLRDSIIQAAEKCQNVVDNLDDMKTELRAFSSL